MELKIILRRNSFSGREEGRVVPDGDIIFGNLKPLSECSDMDL